MKQLLSFIAVVVLATAACSDAFTPTADNMLGDYTARTLTTTDTHGTVEWIARGASLTISLGPSGTVTGHLFLPAAATGGGDLDTPLIGNWVLTGSTISFDMPAIDTFIRDMPWTADRHRLSGDHTFSGTRIRVVLTK